MLTRSAPAPRLLYYYNAARRNYARVSDPHLWRNNSSARLAAASHSASLSLSLSIAPFFPLVLSISLVEPFSPGAISPTAPVYLQLPLEPSSPVQRANTSLARCCCFPWRSGEARPPFASIILLVPCQLYSFYEDNNIFRAPHEGAGGDVSAPCTSRLARVIAALSREWRLVRCFVGLFALLLGV